MFKIINKIKSNYIQLKKIFNITDKKIKIVFLFLKVNFIKNLVTI